VKDLHSKSERRHELESSPSAVRHPPITSAGRPPLTKIRWQCRRGMRELDVVLERYLQQRYASAPLAEQQAFESLLDLPDPQLFAYLMRRETPAVPEWVDVLSKLTAFEP
jgi:antitoxin CptB